MSCCEQKSMWITLLLKPMVILCFSSVLMLNPAKTIGNTSRLCGHKWSYTKILGFSFTGSATKWANYGSKARVQRNEYIIHLICCNSPQSGHSSETKEDFYDSLQTTLNLCLEAEELFLGIPRWGFQCQTSLLIWFRNWHNGSPYFRSWGISWRRCWNRQGKQGFIGGFLSREYAENYEHRFPQTIF